MVTTPRFARLSRFASGSNPWAIDAVLATLFVIVGLVTTGDGQSNEDLRDRDALGVALVLATTVPFYVRRRAPLAVLVVSGSAVVTSSAIGYFEGVLPTFVLFASYTVGAHCTLRIAFVGATYIYACLVLLLALDAPGFDAGTFLVQVAFFSSAFLLGQTMQSRRARLSALEERAVALERERDEGARRAVADERLHIAQELHDVVAHSMGVIAVQAGVGAHVIDDDPDEAKRALEAIATTSRATLGEIRRLLGVLRHDGDGKYQPAPGLGDLDRLTREIERAGVDVRVRVEGDPSPLPPGVDLTAYRIVQEALTNVLKHAGPASADVVIGHEIGAVRLEITDDGRGVNGRADGGTGHGLLGMRERVAVYGGTLETGPRVGGGFRVVARLPFAEDT
jgi:signal transduction histidine kinase